MTLFDRLFEAVDYANQQKRLNKINKPYAKQDKELGDKMFQVGSYHPEYSDMSMKQSHAKDKLDRVKSLKKLSKARENLKKSPEDEGLLSKKDNASDAAYRFHRSRYT